MGMITVPMWLFAFPWLFFGITIYFTVKRISFHVRWKKWIKKTLKEEARKRESPQTFHKDRYMKFAIDKDIDIPAVLKKMGIPDPHDGQSDGKEASFEQKSTGEEV